MRCLALYGSTTGNTRMVALRLPEHMVFPVDVVDVGSVSETGALDGYDLLIFLASTWGDGELQVDMERFFVNCRMALDGKHYAVCELGNYYGYDDFEFGALRIIQHHLQLWGGHELVEPFSMDSLPRKDWAGFARWCDLINRTVKESRDE
jgi:flavodoxin